MGYDVVASTRERVFDQGSLLCDRVLARANGGTIREPVQIVRDLVDWTFAKCEGRVEREPFDLCQAIVRQGLLEALQ